MLSLHTTTTLETWNRRSLGSIRHLGSLCGGRSWLGETQRRFRPPNSRRAPTSRSTLGASSPPGADGVVPVVAQDVESRDVLVQVHANRVALDYTLREGVAAFWSLSRDSLWIKGETSGNVLDVEEVRVNCEQNSLLYLSQAAQRRRMPHASRRRRPPQLLLPENRRRSVGDRGELAAARPLDGQGVKLRVPPARTTAAGAERSERRRSRSRRLATGARRRRRARR